MRQFDELPVATQDEIAGKFILPDNTSGVVVDEFNRPFTRVSGALVGCTVINTNFHIHENKNR